MLEIKLLIGKNVMKLTLVSCLTAMVIHVFYFGYYVIGKKHHYMCVSTSMTILLSCCSMIAASIFHMLLSALLSISIANGALML